MTFREKFINDIQEFITNSKWQEALSDIMQQLFEIKPKCAYVYLQKKVALKSKLENNKSTACACQVALYCSNINVNSYSSLFVKDKIISLYVDKYQHTKIRKAQCIQIISFILLECPEKPKQNFMKKLLVVLDFQNNTLISINQVSSIYYYTIVYIHMIAEISELDLKLSREGLSINNKVLKQYLLTVNQQQSIMKKFQVDECLESTGDLYSILGEWIIAKMNI